MNSYLQPDDALTNDKSHIDSMISKVNPYAPPVFVSKGTMTSTLGGRTTFKDVNGGTLLTYDPKTGTITIYGGLISQQNVNIGTLSNSVLSGTISNTGLFMGGTVTGTLQNSIINNSYFTGTITSPIIHGTLNLDVIAGSPTLIADGQFALETKGTSVIIATRLGGTTFYFNPTGTLT